MPVVVANLRFHDLEGSSTKGRRGQLSYPTRDGQWSVSQRGTGVTRDLRYG